MKYSLALALISLLAVLPARAEEFSSLEEQMSAEEFEAAGLDKLSESELSNLNSWIRTRSIPSSGTSKSRKGGSSSSPSESSAFQRPDDLRGFEKQYGLKYKKGKLEPIVSRIRGSFDGWDGHTVFELENGMIWQQIKDKEKFYIKSVENPAVTIRPGSFKTWRLSVDGHSEETRVERIQ